MIFSHVDTIHQNVTDGRTDGRTDTERQQRPRLRIASRGKKKPHCCYCNRSMAHYSGVLLVESGRNVLAVGQTKRGH